MKARRVDWELIRASLKDKLNYSEYVDSLSDRSRRQLELCKLLLSDKELRDISSIRLGYYIARERLIELIKDVNPEFYDRLSEHPDLPIFNVEKILREAK